MLNVLGAFLLPAVPLLVLVAFLLAGRFPGEQAIERLSRRIAAARRRPVRRAPGGRPSTLPASWAPGGGLLIAFGLARRPPPALS
ncbi:MAG TPA: hypothetical protein VN522_13940 [Solirubrobacterales bacterium]|nr:hypothetical protein [Solirubrobacterales bacterium]